MKHALLLGVAGALLVAPAFAQTPSTSEFVNKAAQSDMLEVQSSQFVAPNADADTKPFAGARDGLQAIRLEFIRPQAARLYG